MRVCSLHRGFTLVEVLIALAITVLVSTIAYRGLSVAIAGVQSSRREADRTYDVDRAWMIISRDIHQFVERPVRDEFGDTEAALQGGPAARFPLSLTHGGWHNSTGQPRSELQRVNYWLQDNALWRGSYPVLDRAADTEPRPVMLLDGVEDLQLRFLGSLASVQSSRRGVAIDTRNWSESWVADGSTPGVPLTPPVALEVRLQLQDWGEVWRLYVLPPL